jgi:phage terminase small subunit
MHHEAGGIAVARAHPLTAKQQLFIQEYLVDLNAAQAAARAGYSGKSVREIGSRLLTKVNIQAALTEAMAARVQRVHLTQDAVLREIALLSQSNIAHYEIDHHGEVRLRPGAPPDAMRAVQSLRKKVLHTEQGTFIETEIKLHPKTPNLRMAGEHLNLFRPMAPDLPDIHIHIEAARERLTDRLRHLATRHAEDAPNGH